MVNDHNLLPVAAAALARGAMRGGEKTGEEAVKRIERGFQSGSDALGRSWAPLSPETIREKGHDQILVREGDLRSSFTVESSFLRGEVSIGTEDPKAPIHEFGVPENSLPSRPMLRPAASWIEQEGIDSVLAPAIENELSKLSIRI